MTSRLWEEVGDLFHTDDGSLPEIRVNYIDPQASFRGYELLHKRAAQIFTGSFDYSSNGQDLAEPTDPIRSAAARAATSDSALFHVVLSGIRSRDTIVPDLGVFVFTDQLALDYKMGSHWGARELSALFVLLHDLTSLDSMATLTLEDGVDREVAERFQDAWRSWSADDPT